MPGYYKFPAFCVTRRFITVFKRARLLSLYWAKRSVQVRGLAKCFVILHVFMVSCQQLATLRTTTCQLTAIAYSVYRQLPSICGGRSFNRSLRTRLALETRTHLPDKTPNKNIWRPVHSRYQLCCFSMICFPHMEYQCDLRIEC